MIFIEGDGNTEYSKRPVEDSRSVFNRYAREYDEWFDKQGELIFASEVAAFKNVLPSLPKPWLEIGVGSGRFAQALGIEKGVEPSFKMAEIAGERGINVSVSRGDNTRFADGTFGAVFLIVTLCFLNSPLSVLKEANHILMTEGKIVLGLVLKESPWGQFYLQKKAQGHRFYKYATFYSFSEVTELLEKADFNYADTISTLFQKPGDVKHIEDSRNGYHPEAGFTVMTAYKQ